MENSSLKEKVISEIENLISQSAPNRENSQKFKNLHVAILKKHYNASDVSIDYHRNRVAMDIIMDDSVYDPKKVNTYMPIFRANLLFKNLNDFLKSCLDQDHKSLAFYASLLRSFSNKELNLMAV
tara:strand:+ start:79459 stop:79833 length:375 start_codon:yes stop_codon:yes gene_type:complete